jgi:hypothetical protein
MLRCGSQTLSILPGGPYNELMDHGNSVCVETYVQRDGMLTLDGLPFRAGDHLIVQIAPARRDGVRRFPMRGRRYEYLDPFEPATLPDEWEAQR